MVEVFKTNVQKNNEAKMLLKQLICRLPNHIINFDLSDCDKILRVKGDHFQSQGIIDLINIILNVKF